MLGTHSTTAKRTPTSTTTTMEVATSTLLLLRTTGELATTTIGRTTTMPTTGAQATKVGLIIIQPITDGRITLHGPPTPPPMPIGQNHQTTMLGITASTTTSGDPTQIVTILGDNQCKQWEEWAEWEE